LGKGRWDREKDNNACGKQGLENTMCPHFEYSLTLPKVLACFAKANKHQWQRTALYFPPARAGYLGFKASTDIAGISLWPRIKAVF
jgi:hypothetical protein